MSTSTESMLAGLASPGLDEFSFTVLTIPDQGVQLGSCDPKILASQIGAGEALSRYSLWATSWAFNFVPGPNGWPFVASFKWLCFGPTTKGAIIRTARFKRSRKFGFD